MADEKSIIDDWIIKGIFPPGLPPTGTPLDATPRKLKGHPGKSVLSHLKERTISPQKPTGKWWTRKPGTEALYAEPDYAWQMGEVDPPGIKGISKLKSNQFLTGTIETLKAQKKFIQPGKGQKPVKKVKAELHEATKKYFGVTDDPAEAGYILDDGDMLDFSGKNQGGTPGMRAFDHREIQFVDDEESGVLTKGIDGWFDGDSNTENMRKFMKETGAIRTSLQRDGSANIDIQVYPTDEQWYQIKRMVSQAEEVYVDITGKWNKGQGIFSAGSETIAAKQFDRYDFDEIKDFVGKHLKKVKK